MDERNDLPQLPKGWAWARLGDVCETTSGGTPSRKYAEYFNGDIPWLKSGELENGVINSVEERISRAGLESSSSKIVPRGTLLIALYGATVGRLGILGIDAAINQAVCAIFTPSELETRFLFWFLIGHRSELLNLRQGGAQPNISQQVVKDIEFPFCSLAEQHRIVTKIEELFSDLDAGVAELEKAKAQLKRYRQAVLKAAVEGKLTAEWRAANKDKIEPASVLLERIRAQRIKNANRKDKVLPLVKAAELGKLPEGWEWTTLEQVAAASRYSISSGPFGSALGTKDYINEGIPIIRGQNIKSGRFVFDNLVYISEEKATTLIRSSAYPGDLIIVAVGSSGDPAIVPPSLKRAILSQNCNKITLAQNVALPDYVVKALQVEVTRNQLLEKTTDTARPFLSLTNLRHIRLPLPPFAEQEQIAATVDRYLSVADEIGKTLEVSLQQADRLRQSILKRAFEGKLVPQDQSDESAEKLLERIRESKKPATSPDPARLSPKSKKANRKQPRLIS